jgi:hypothetical protein
MKLAVITPNDTERRHFWVQEIGRLSGNFGDDADRLQDQMSDDVSEGGIARLLGHLRLCGAIPEEFGHDSSEEKMYSKYTDIVIHEAFKAIGLTSAVLQERSGVADVECVATDFSFVADAKAFRLSRTAKNQKDFKVEALNGWKYGKPFAMLVCPVYQFPSRSSQIYQQATTRSVTICSYTHLAVLARYADLTSSANSMSLLHDVFMTVKTMNPSPNAGAYWQVLNSTFLQASPSLPGMWKEEKIASIEAIRVAQQEALTHFARERERIMRLSRADAIREFLSWRKLENKERAVRSVKDRGLMDFA